MQYFAKVNLKYTRVKQKQKGAQRLSRLPLHAVVNKLT